MSTLIFGPRGGGAHNVDEYVEIESVIQNAGGLVGNCFNVEWLVEFQ